MVSSLTFICLIASTTPNLASDAPDKTQLALRLSAGTEWDTNVNRNLSISREDPRSDGLVRLLMDMRLNHQITRRHRLNWSYILGAKRFQEADEEDVIVQNFQLGTQHYFGRQLDLQTNARYRQSRMRSILRDYDLTRVGLKLRWQSSNVLSLWIGGGAHHFVFPNETRLNYAGPYASAGLTWNINKYFQWDLFSLYEQQSFDGNALSAVVAPGTTRRVASFCDELEQRVNDSCTSKLREDSFFVGSAKITYQRLFIFGAEVQFQGRRSNSVYEDLNRIRFSLFSTFDLGYEIVLNALAALQYTSEQSLSQNLFQYQPEDDENQNRLTIQLSRVIYSSISGLFRYELFANAFATSDTAFFRQTLFGGLSFEIDS